MAKKNKFSSYNLGSCSILIIFVTVCLTTFSTLSMVSANSDYSLSLKAAENATEFYAADNKAEQKLAKIDNVLKNHIKDIKSDYITNVVSSLYLRSDISITQQNDKLTIIFNVPINDNQYIEPIIEIKYPQADGKRYTIKSWKVVTQSQEMEETPLNVWNPNS